MKIAVGYARVSTREEDITNQTKAILEYAEKNGIKIAKIFEDNAVTGASNPFNREKFLEMYNYCKRENINKILIYDLTRLGRSLITSIQTLKKLLDEEFEVYFIRHNMKADLKDPTSKVMIYTLLMIAEIERDFIKMRQQEAWRQGKQKGRPPAMKLEQVRKYVLKYKELAKHNKKALWMIAKAEGHKISYPRFLVKVNKILKELGWW